MDVYKTHMGPARCAADLGDGSERGEYVNQDYILHALGRPHRAINLMYCYYPLDAGWPARASELPTEGKVGFAWDFAYDDYFPYGGGLEGGTAGEPFASMRDIRRHGQDVILTLTADCGVSDAQLVRIAQDLRPYGRLQLRINHEATGTWFAFNKRYSYQQVADFFARFHRIVKEHAPHIQTILCIGGGDVRADGKMKGEDEFAQAIAAADIWSADVYLSLHWGWPYDVAEPGGKSHKRADNATLLKGLRAEYARFMAKGNQQKKPFLLSEANADGDVNGPYEQAEQVRDFYARIPRELPELTGITFYQFRDRGRLGLEIEDPANPQNGFAQPVLAAYKEILRDPYYTPAIQTESEAVCLPCRLRWGGSEDADGVAVPLRLEQNPAFCEFYFDEENQDLSLMVEVNGKWFYKKPGVKCLDVMPAFFEKPLTGETQLTALFFATPPDGVNDPAQGDGWETNYYAELRALPTLRVRYTAVM